MSPKAKPIECLTEKGIRMRLKLCLRCGTGEWHGKLKLCEQCLRDDQRGRINLRYKAACGETRSLCWKTPR